MNASGKGKFIFREHKQKQLIPSRVARRLFICYSLGFIFIYRIGASGEQTFLKVDESLINAANLSGASVMANSRHILLLPTAAQPDSASFRSLAISRNDGFCRLKIFAPAFKRISFLIQSIYAIVP